MLLVHAIHNKSQRLSQIQWKLQGQVAENTLCTTRKQYTSTIQNPNNNFVSIKSPKNQQEEIAKLLTFHVTRKQKILLVKECGQIPIIVFVIMYCKL